MWTLKLKELTMYLPSSCGLGSLSQSFLMPSLARPSKTNTWYCPSRTWNPVIMSNVLLFRWSLRKESNQTNWLRQQNYVSLVPSRSRSLPITSRALRSFPWFPSLPYLSSPGIRTSCLWRRQEFCDIHRPPSLQIFRMSVFFFLLKFKPRNNERFLVSESTSLVRAKADPSPTFRLFYSLEWINGNATKQLGV